MSSSAVDTALKNTLNIGTAGSSSSTSGSEVSKKIRAAIKAKLQELGVYVDEELPDYIMVMIANKKDRQRMKDDLQLFLQKSSGKFVDWLFEIFERLQAVNRLDSNTASPADDKGNDGKHTTIKSREKTDSRSKKDRKHSDKSAKKSDRHKSTSDSKKRSSSSITKKTTTDKHHMNVEPKSSGALIDDDSRESRSARLKPHKTERRPTGETDLHHHKSAAGSRNVLKRQHEDQSDDNDDIGGKKALHRHVREHSPLSSPMKSSIIKIVPSVNQPIKLRLAHRRVNSKDDDDDADNNMTARKGEESARLSSRVNRLEKNEHNNSDSDEHDHSRKLLQRSRTGNDDHSSGGESSDNNEKQTTTKSREKTDSRWRRERKYSDKDSKKSDRHKSTFSDNKKTLSSSIVKKTTSTTIDTSHSSVDPKTSGVLIVDDSRDSRSGRLKTNTRFVVTMTGLEDNVFINRRTSSEVKSAGETNRDQHKIAIGSRNVLKREHDTQSDDNDDIFVKKASHRHVRELSPLSSPPPKPSIIKIMPSMKASQPIKLRLAHRRVTSKDEDERRNEASVRLSSRVNRSENDARDNSDSDEEYQRRKLLQQTSTDINTNAPMVVNKRKVVHSETTTGGNSNKLTTAWASRFNAVSIELDDDDEEDEIDAAIANSLNGSYVSGAFESQTSDNTTVTTTAVNEVPPTLNLSRPHNFVLPASDKIHERCKFWPACRLADKCVYMHPSKQCKYVVHHIHIRSGCRTFPNCAFGDKCLYIHPNCKFDKTCTRANCPYTHASRPLIPASSTPTIPLSPAPLTAAMQALISCKFADKCLNTACPFKHPKPCRFGRSCLNTQCIFSHPPKTPPVVSKKRIMSAKYKWKAALEA